MGAVFESLRIEASRIPVKSIRDWNSVVPRVPSIKIQPELEHRKEQPSMITEEPLSVAPLAILVEMVLAVGGGVGAEAVVVAQASLE